jgi:hypothetical protein
MALGAIATSYGVESAERRRASASRLPLLFLTSRIPATEPYGSDRFEVGFGFGYPQLSGGWPHLDTVIESSSYLIPEGYGWLNHALSIAPNPNLLKVIGAIKAAADARNRLKRQ